MPSETITVPMFDPREIAAIVPALNEEEALPLTLARLTECGFDIVVVDGGSRDGTVRSAKGLAGRILVSSPGRARQMNLGAAAAAESGARILFFVHADSHPPANARQIILQTLSRPGIVAGAFRLKIESGDPRLCIISALANLRSRLARLPYGDQGIFLKCRDFEGIGGYKDIPLMEDVELIGRLKEKGRIAIAPGIMRTSARRWRNQGVVKTSIKNVIRLMRFRMGVPPEILARGYRNIR